MGLKISGIATMQNLNVRKEGSGDDMLLAADIKLSCDIDAHILDQMVGEKDSLYSSLYDKKGNPKFGSVDDLAIDCEFKNHELTVDSLNKTFHTTRIDKVSAHLRLNSVATITFRIQLHPTKEELADFAELVKEEFEFSIQGQPELAFDNEGQAEESA